MRHRPARAPRQGRGQSFIIVREFTPDLERQVRALTLLLSGVAGTNETATVGKTMAVKGVRDGAAQPSS